MTRLFPAALFLAALGAAFLPGVPSFWVTLADYAGIAGIVALGLVVLTGYGGMTSFGQATFMGCGAYVSALLTTTTPAGAPAAARSATRTLVDAAPSTTSTTTPRRRSAAPACGWSTAIPTSPG